MGWSGGNEIFDAMARRLQRVPHALQVETMVALIRSLEAQDWDTADESLEDWKHVAGYVEAFKNCGYDVEEEERVVEIDIYVHDDAECGYYEHLSKGDRAKLGWPQGDQRYALDRIAYEICLNLEVNTATGDTKIVGVNGRKLMDAEE